jgi:hypothetical protein
MQTTSGVLKLIKLGLTGEARWRLAAAGEGSRPAAEQLHEMTDALIAAVGMRDAYACEILAAMCASGLGAARNLQDAREWLTRAVELLEEDVRRPLPGPHGFMLLPSAEPRNAYRPLYTGHGVLITDEIGTACIEDGAVLFDRWGRPLLEEARDGWSGPTRATPKSVAARIARESTLEDFAWACHRTTAQFRAALIDARVIAHGRMGFQRCKARPEARMAAVA